MRSTRPTRAAQGVAIAAFIASLVTAAGALAAVAFYMTIPGIPGDATSTVVPSSIEVTRYRLSSSIPLGATQPRVDALVVTQGVDRSTPLLFEAFVRRTVLPTLTIATVRAGGAKGLMPHQYVELTNARVESFRQSLAGEGSATQEITLRFDTITLRDFPVSPTGMLGTETRTTYDTQTGGVM